ncbi:Ceramide-1-phosphate transfer protein [Morella rubra]|uniref:Ceramide-1-phosphate transfer protein n=1 Tax=Morella rubra TaxID=262757 RepID=A0A6A1W306_9ROSI|nr:Ceramide-1-phosphate transfer protein [Morella rubra]
MEGKNLKDATMTPLAAVAEAFEEMAELLKSRKEDQHLRLDTFCQACSLFSVLFGCLGLAFKFAKSEYLSMIRDLEEGSKTYSTLQDIINADVANKRVKTQGSHSRNLRRVRQGLDLIRVLFEQFVSTEEHSLKEAASRAYRQVCAPYHCWSVRTAVAAGMCTLPAREKLLVKLKETDSSAEKKMRRYISAADTIIEYINNLYLSKNISLDW